jgi:hypothetical protein
MHCTTAIYSPNGNFMQQFSKIHIPENQPIVKFYMLKNIVLLQDIKKVHTFAP